MIAVAANTEDYDLVREFFELFKTPWEFYRPEGQYDVVLFAREDASAQGVAAKLVVVYSSQKTPYDEEEKVEITSHRNSGTLSYKESPLPIYGKNVTIQANGVSILTDEESSQSVGFLDKSGRRVIARIGYDLFKEMRALLTDGQPAEYASSPTVEIHIALLRDLIVGSGACLVEVPPVPDGYTFIACLTHDVDHPSIRQHKWDHTMVGFLHRAVLGSLFAVLRGRIPVRHLLTNWVAVARLPFIHLGLARDFWYDFDRYLDIERDLNSTFFVLPFKDHPGVTALGQAPSKRAARYAATDIAGRLHGIVSAGHEVGLHGIDAWIDIIKGQHEMAQITNITGRKNIGVRMHWLYFDHNSPVVLEKAGFSYDSTVGYNETIGYRAGTAQVYKPLQTCHLLELPLHVMDTALFYPGYLNLSAAEASRQVGAILNNAIKFGGVVTFNWHDRSLAPERLWGGFYTSLISKLKQKGAWCTSAGSAVSWFRNRRSVVFERNNQGLEVARPKTDLVIGKGVPGLRLRIYNSRRDSDSSSECYVDSALTSNAEMRLDSTCVVTHC